MNPDDNKSSDVASLISVVVLIVAAIWFFGHLHSPTVWQANYETTLTDQVYAGQDFDTEAACLDYIHGGGFAPDTYGWECGSNCKKMDSSPIAPFECDQTAQ